MFSSYYVTLCYIINKLSFKHVSQKSFSLSFFLACLRAWSFILVVLIVNFLVHGLFSFVCFTVSKLAAINPPRWVSGYTHEMNSSKAKFVCLGFFHFFSTPLKILISLWNSSPGKQKQILLRVSGWGPSTVEKAPEAESILSAVLSQICS